MSVGLSHYLVVAAALFSLGVLGLLTRRNAVNVLMSIELMLNAVNMAFVTFARGFGSSPFGPEEGAGFWQPVPANGFVRCLLDSRTLGAETAFAFGTQTVDPGCHVREHVHDANEEIIFVGEHQVHFHR